MASIGHSNCRFETSGRSTAAKIIEASLLSEACSADLAITIDFLSHGPVVVSEAGCTSSCSEFIVDFFFLVYSQELHFVAHSTAIVCFHLFFEEALPNSN